VELKTDTRFTHSANIVDSRITQMTHTYLQERRLTQQQLTHYICTDIVNHSAQQQKSLPKCCVVKILTCYSTMTATAFRTNRLLNWL